MPPLEAMATGLPIIITGWSGVMEYYKPEYALKLDYKMVPAENFTNVIYKEDCGNWAEPSLDDLIDKLKWAYNNRSKLKEMGKLASQEAHTNWQWKDKINMFHEALDKNL